MAKLYVISRTDLAKTAQAPQLLEIRDWIRDWVPRRPRLVPRALNEQNNCVLFSIEVTEIIASIGGHRDQRLRLRGNGVRSRVVALRAKLQQLSEAGAKIFLAHGCHGQGKLSKYRGSCHSKCCVVDSAIGDLLAWGVERGWEMARCNY